MKLASSGTAATLLDGGQTAHSALRLPLNTQISETPAGNIAKNSAMTKILHTCKLIVLDKCTIAPNEVTGEAGQIAEASFSKSKYC